MTASNPQNLRCFLLSVLVSASVLALFWASAAHATPVVDTPPHNVLHRPLPVPGSTEWTTWAWTGDSARYLRAERDVYKAYEATSRKDPSAGRFPAAVLAKYGAAALRDTGNPVAGFQYAYADMMRINEEQHVDSMAMTILQGIDPGNIREYARIRYCLTLLAEPNNNHDSINKVAERLLKTDPQDGYVRQLYIYDLCMNAKDLPKALKLAHESVERQPLSARPHSVLGYVYENEFFSSRRLIDRDSAVREYKRFLALAPPDDNFRGQAQYLIGALMKETRQADRRVSLTPQETPGEKSH